MTEAFDRLKTALKDRYTIERELGAGGMATLSFIAEAYVMLGDYDAAIEQLRILMMSWRWHFSPARLRFDPIYHPLRDHPGFQELLEGGN